MAVAILIAAGLASRRFPGVLPGVLGKYPGDSLWAAVVFVGMGALLRSWATLPLAFLAWTICLGVEFAKLSSATWLAALRQTTPGYLLLGHAFDERNLLAYTVGILLAVAAEMTSDRMRRPPNLGTGDPND
ncbi:MAG TPA: DUF2809 domain-containing protein [Candidatus Didemnitutus sp.]|nr:DUF2809 domain-containing protein [Candidatus Didemnitutus sp.]